MLCPALPHSSSPAPWGRAEDELQQLEPQEEKDVVWRYAVHRGVVGQRWRLSLGTVLLMPVPNSGTSTLPNSVTWAQDDSGQAPAKSWGPAAGGTRRVKDLPLTMDQVVAIKGEVRTCTVQVTAR